MRLPLVGVTISLLSYFAGVAAQTFTDCNPREKTCPPKPALGRSATFDFTDGHSDEFAEVGTPSYDSNGAGFTVAKQGDAPLIQSKWYIMFGRVEAVIKTAPGTGIVSSAVLQSDDLDEIDWEWLGANDLYVQTNYFGKGNTGSYNRGATHDNRNNHDEFHTYTIDWTSKQIVWQIDGQTVRSLTPDDAPDDQYPQSPMMVKIGVWAGGDPNNPDGTIQWAGGETDYSAGPYTMYLKSLEVTDYSTGSSYAYGDKSGSWQSIVAEDGQVEGNNAEPQSTVAAPPVTSTVQNIPIPWSGTHRETSSFVTPSIWPWVPTPTTLVSSTSESTSLPSGWTFSGSGSVQPPSASSSLVRSTSALSLSSPVPLSPSGTETQSSGVSSAASSTTDSTSSTGTIVSTSPTSSIISTGSTSSIGSRPMTSHSISLTPSSSSNRSKSKATATANDSNEHPDHGHPSYTGPVHVAPTADASSHTVRISALGVVCALFGNALAMF